MLSIGEILNETYRIDERIGAGGGGEVFKAYHLRMKKYVAIKRIKEEVKGILNIRAEVDLLKGINNEHIPNVSDFIELDGDIYTIMDFIEGDNLEHIYKKREEPYSEAVIKDYALQLCNAVKCIHNKKPPIIHSDIKPANVMQSADGKVFLIDFNISAIASGNVLSMGGSNGYSAPEQYKRMIKAPVVVSEFHEETRFLSDEETVLLDESENYDVPLTNKNSTYSTQKTKNIEHAYIDTRTDIYGLGATLHYLLTKRKPVNGETDFRGVKVSQDMQKIIRKAMESNPDKRYQKIEDMEDAIRNIGKTRKTIAAIAAAAAVIALTMGITVLVTDNKNHEAAIAADEMLSMQQAASDNFIITEETRAEWAEQLSEVVKTNYLENVEYVYLEDFNSDGAPDVVMDKSVYDAYNTLLGEYDYSNGMHFRKNKDDEVVLLKEEDFGDTEPFYFTGKTASVSDKNNCYNEIKELVDIYADYVEFEKNSTEEELEKRIYIRDSVYAGDTDYIDLVRYKDWDIDSADIAVAEILGVKSTLKSLLLNDHFAVDDEFSKICRIDGLEELTVYGNIPNFEKISQLTSLKKLKIQSDELTDLSPLTVLNNLNELDLSLCRNLSDLTYLSVLTNLTSLKLYGCSSISDLSPLTELKNLEYLDLSFGWGNITDLTPLTELTGLKYLNMCWNGGNDADLSPLSKLTDLEYLDLS